MTLRHARLRNQAIRAHQQRVAPQEMFMRSILFLYKLTPAQPLRHGERPCLRFALGLSLVFCVLTAHGCQDHSQDSSSNHSENTTASLSPREAPEGMVWVPGGTFWMGSEDPRFPDAQPRHQVQLDGFFMDASAVTNTQFALFIEATGYVTVAERRPTRDQYPNASADMLVPGSIVFAPPDEAVDLQGSHLRWWRFVPGANWKQPEGPGSSLDGRDNHPVVHIAYEDAEAYAAWRGRALPTEAEFEYAARGGLDRQPFVWGATFTPNGKHMANTFQGHFPDRNTMEDGYATTAPVNTFPANGYGLYGMSGNVWEWTSDWYRPETYAIRSMRPSIVRNPTGPESSHDPAEPGIPKRVHRGGSFLCTDQYCSRYMPAGRGKGATDTGTNHLGFRTVVRPKP